MRIKQLAFDITFTVLYKCADGKFARFSGNNTRFMSSRKRKIFIEIIDAEREDCSSIIAQREDFIPKRALTFQSM